MEKDKDMPSERNTIPHDRILMRRLLKAEALFPEWLRKNPSILATAMDREQVLDLIGKENWNAFDRFMRGQGLGVRDGESVFFRSDVETFARTLDKKKAQ